MGSAQWQAQREAGTAARALAVPAQIATQFLGEIRARVQTEPVPVFLGGESELEQPLERTRLDPDSRILDVDRERARRLLANTNRQEARAPGLVPQRMTCVAQQVPEYLNQLVAVEREARSEPVVALDRNIGAVGEIERQGVVGQFTDIHLFADAAAARMALLRGDDLADVLDVRDDGLHVGLERAVFGPEMLPQLGEIARHFVPARIVFEERPQPIALRTEK